MKAAVVAALGLPTALAAASATSTDPLWQQFLLVLVPSVVSAIAVVWGARISSEKVAEHLRRKLRDDD